MKITYLTAFVIAGLSTPTLASDDLYEYRVELGNANEDIETFSLVFRKDFSSRFKSSFGGPRLLPPSFNAYLDTSIFSWTSPENNLLGAAVVPTLAYKLKPIRNFTPYAELGLGVALISDTTIGERDMSSAFHFKSSIAIGLHTESLNFFLKAEHFSNAGLATPNWGLDVLSVGVGFKF